MAYYSEQAMRAARPFRAGNRTMTKWLRAELKVKKEIDAVLPWVRKSYLAARREKKRAEQKEG